MIVIYLLILPLNNTFNDFATQEGFPQLATRAVAAGSAANVVLDILFIGVLGMGISGAAWGTVISGLINLALISPWPVGYSPALASTTSASAWYRYMSLLCCNWQVT